MFSAKRSCHIFTQFIFTQLILLGFLSIPATAAAQEEPTENAPLKEVVAYTAKQVNACMPLLGKSRPQGDDLETVLAVIPLCDRILNTPKIKDSVRIWMLQRKGVLLEALTRWNPDAYAGELAGVADELETFLEKEPKAVPTWSALASTLLKADAFRLRNGGAGVEPAEYDRIINRLHSFVVREEDPDKGRKAIRYLMEFVKHLPPAKRDDFLLRMVRTLAPHYQKSEFMKERLYGDELAGLGRRIELPGNQMLLDGYVDNENKLDTRSLRGKVVLVDFWETTCAPCMQQMPDLIRIYQKYKPYGFEIVGVAATENLATVRIFLQSKTFEGGLRMNWPVIVDSVAIEKKEQSISKLYGVTSFPTMFLIGRDGNVISSSVDARTLTHEIDKALEEKAAPRRTNRPETIPSPPAL